MAIDGICVQDCKAPDVGVSENMVQTLANALKAGDCSLYNPSLWPVDYAEQLLQDGGLNEEFDFVVVGAGSAGSVVASRLSESPNIKVLVLEVGGDPPKESEMSLMPALLRTKFMWNDYSTPTGNSCLAMIDESCYWAHGKMIGGGGGANGNVFLTGTPENYDDWEKLGNRGWSWRNIQKYYAKAQEQKGNTTHPIGGLVLNYNKKLPQMQFQKALFFRAAQEIHLPLVKNFYEGSYIGFTDNVLTTTEKGRRMSTGKTYLGKVASKRPNLKVIKNAYVTKLVFGPNNNVVGVNFTVQGKFNFTARARKEVILSAGAINSPKILLHSGIGPNDHLESLGISVRKSLQVGKNLQDHGTLPFYFTFNNGNIPTTDERAEYQTIFDYFLYSEGVIANPNTEIAFLNSNPYSFSSFPDMQISNPTIGTADNLIRHLTAFGIRQEYSQMLKSEIGKRSALVVYTSLMKPQTRGIVSLRSSNVYDPPQIDYEFGEHIKDKAAIVRFVRYLQRMQNTKAFRTYKMRLIHMPFPKCTGLPKDSKDYWLCYAKYLLIGSYHETGTCRMGPQSDPDAVVDERLRVHGVDGIRIIDASIMPIITSGNTNAPAIVIGEKGASMVLEDWGISVDKNQG